MQVDILIVSVHMVVDLVPIEQLYDVLSVGLEFHRPENWSLWNAATDAKRIGVAITNGERLRAIGQVRVKSIQRRAFNRETTM